MSYQIFSDSSFDLPKEYIEQYNITSIPFYVSFDQENYLKEIEEISISEFYNKLAVEKVFPKTSLPSVDDYMTHFKTALDNNEDILCMCLTSKFSGSYQSAMTAKDLLEEEYPSAQIRVIDSILATGAQGLLVLQAAKMKAAGYSIHDNADQLEQLKHTSRVMFTIGTLEYLQKGGRIGKAAALAGNLLNLKPLIQLHEGELVPISKVRGRKKSIEKVLEQIEEFFESIEEQYYQYDFCVITGNEHQTAELFKEKLVAMIDQPIPYPIFNIGTTIGTNTGPDVIGACFIKRFDA